MKYAYFNYRFCKVKAIGKIIGSEDKDVCVTDEIEILEEIVFTPEILNKLAQSKNTWIRHIVAGNPNTSPKTLKILAKDECYSVRCVVAKNPSTDLETLKILADNKLEDICCSVKHDLAVTVNFNQYDEGFRLFNKDESCRCFITKDFNIR